MSNTKKTVYESQKASAQVHEGGSYVVKSGKPVKVNGKPEKEEAK